MRGFNLKVQVKARAIKMKNSNLDLQYDLRNEEEDEQDKLVIKGEKKEARGDILLQEYDDENEEKQLVSDDSDDQHRSETKMMQALKEEEQNFCMNDDSDDNASEDNLRDRDLYQQVYLKRNDSIEDVMRQTTRAQNNFIQEVQVMITKKDQLEAAPRIIQNKNKIAVELQKAASGMNQPIVSLSQEAAQSLQLKGTTIEKPKPEVGNQL